MKTTVLAILFTVLMLPAIGQTRYGITAGLNVANEKVVAADGAPADLSNRVSLNGGLFLEHQIHKSLFLHWELIISGKGSVLESSINGIDVKFTFSPTYVEVPLLIGIKPNRKKGISPFLFAGPFLAMGIGGDAVIEANGQKERVSIEFGDNSEGDLYTLFDVGIAIRGGLEFSNGLQFSAFADLGLKNTFPGSDGHKQHSRVWGFSLSFLF